MILLYYIDNLDFSYLLFLSFYLRGKKKEKVGKRKKKHANFLRPSGVQAEWLCSAIAFAIAESLWPRKLGAGVITN